MTAITGIVMNGQIIEIENLFVNAREPPIAPYNFDFWIFSSKNQRSARDAGPWSVTSYTRIQGEDYVVDNGASETSFIAEVGTLTAAAPITVTNPVTSGLNSIYTLSFIPNGRIGIGGQIVV